MMDAKKIARKAFKEGFRLGYAVAEAEAEEQVRLDEMFGSGDLAGFVGPDDGPSGNEVADLLKPFGWTLSDSDQNPNGRFSDIVSVSRGSYRKGS